MCQFMSICLSVFMALLHTTQAQNSFVACITSDISFVVTSGLAQLWISVISQETSFIQFCTENCLSVHHFMIFLTFVSSLVKFVYSEMSDFLHTIIISFISGC